jgi:hypothetical protein
MTSSSGSIHEKGLPRDTIVEKVFKKDQNAKFSHDDERLHGLKPRDAGSKI